MRNWRQSLLLAAPLLVFVLGFSLVTHLRSSPTPEDNVAVAARDGEEPAQPVETIITTAANEQEPAKPETVVVALKNDGKPISEDQAVKIAGYLLGVDKEARFSAKLGKVTDKTVPFVKVVDLPVWTVTFTDLALFNPEFSTLTCLLDAKTGALLKVSSPLPASGAVYTEAHPEELAERVKQTNFTAIGASSLADAGIKPLIPLLSELKNSKKTVQPAKQLVAYIGLYTGNGIKTKYVDHPCWLINTGGLQFDFYHSIVSDVNFYVDGTSGKGFKTGFFGKSDGTSPVPR